MTIQDQMPSLELNAGEKSEVSFAKLALKELCEAIDFIEMMGPMTPVQQKVWERYRKETLKFAQSMMLASKDIGAIEREIDSRNQRD